MVGGARSSDGDVQGVAPDPVLVSAKAMVFVDDPSSPVLTSEDARHLLDVLRLRPGEPVIAGDGAGSWVPCRVSGASLSVDGDLRFEQRPVPELVVGFVPVKGDRPEWVVQKLTEVGVDRIVPVRSRRSVVRWEGDRSQRAVERLRRVAREASAQCRRPRLPEVGELCTLEELGERTGQAPYLAHPGGPPPSLARPVMVVGPEGGWDADELAGSAGTVGLGPTVLRSETAAVVSGAILCALRSGVT
jgi:16S rRNA (uracil1498-N3)-methyltransferase